MKIAHLSDLHFGRSVLRDRVEALTRDLLCQDLELLVVTGDVTDRGTKPQFRQAKEFLEAAGIPYVCVPGNREISASAFWEWAFPPLAMSRYRHFFGADDRILYQCSKSGAVFLGLNSVHWFPSWPGKIDRGTRYWLKEQAARFEGVPKVLFLHHPVLPVIRGSSFWAHSLADAGELLNICTQFGISLILQGHKHRANVVELYFPERNARVIVSSGGAPLMDRWDAVYHVIDLSASRVAVHPREFTAGSFTQSKTFAFSLDGESPHASECRGISLVR